MTERDSIRIARGERVKGQTGMSGSENMRKNSKRGRSEEGAVGCKEGKKRNEVIGK